MHKPVIIFIHVVVLLCASCWAQEGWITLFNGESLDGWKASENPGSFRVEEGAIVCAGPRAHLFYTGEDGKAIFRNFELKAKVKTAPGANSGIFFHTKFQDTGWPSNGYEAQVFNSQRPGQTGYAERKMTGSLYAVRNLWKTPAKDNEWFDYSIRVQGKTIRIFINDTLVVDYTEPENTPATKGRILSSGTFALQCHDPGSTVFFKDLKARRLPDALPTPENPPADEALDRRLTELGLNNFPLVDYHVHLKGDLTTEDLLAKAREYGFTYGIAFNCGLRNPLPDETSLRKFLDEYKRIPGTYLAMQAEGREWMDLFTRES
ncbi:MAG: DUF1080 domain-containing protein, partial [Acidobacteriota bacterium]